MVVTDASGLTATDYKSSRLTVEQYAGALLKRIKARDPLVKAWAYLRDEKEILQEARHLDQMPVDKRGSLHGVPIALKDIINTKDMPTRHHSDLHVHDPLLIDAQLVLILRKAGALLMGKASTTELAIAGRQPSTINPYDAERAPGWSSVGSAVGVADMQVPMSIGSQSVGSTIMPSSFMGICGMKPTYGTISVEGFKAFARGWDTVGLMARSMPDLRLLFEALEWRGAERPEPSPTLPECRFALIKGLEWSLAGPSTVKAMQQATELLRAAGAIVEEVILPTAFQPFPTWRAAILSYEGAVSLYGDHVASRAQLSDDLDRHFFPHEHGAPPPTTLQYIAAMDGVASLRPQFDALADQYTAIVTPSTPDVAPLMVESPGAATFNGLWTALHAPVVNVPGLKGELDLPIGLSLVAGRGTDRQLLSVSEMVHEVFKER